MISLQTLLLIVIIIFSIIFLVSAFVLTWIFAKRRVKNDITKAIIIISQGEECPSYKGKLRQITKLGIRYDYDGKVVFVPNKYKPRFHNHKRLVFLNKIGQLISSPFEDDEKLSTDERDELILEFVTSHVGADGMRALKGVKAGNIILIAIIAFIAGIVITFGVIQFQEMAKQKQAQVQPPITQDIKDKTEIPIPEKGDE